MTGILASQDVTGFFNQIILTPTFGYINIKVQYLPNFEPNDYFWEHHWQEGKEEKWQAFARVVRQIMCEAGGF